jgi:formylglycine-generating enzyme required for sulfatase activity
VEIGSPSNTADASGNPSSAGSVDYTYFMGKFEVSESMFTKAVNQGLADHTPPLTSFGPDKPEAVVSWGEAARFVNWLNTDQGFGPAYKFNGTTFQLWESGDAGYDPTNVFRNTLANYVLPTTDEWYKSAYYDPASGGYFLYPTGINTNPRRHGSGVGRLQ